MKLAACEVGARSETRAVTKAEPPTGDVASIAGARKQTSYARFYTALAMKIASVYFRGKPPPRYIPATRVFRYPLYGGAAPVTPPNFCPAVFLCLKGYIFIFAVIANVHNNFNGILVFPALLSGTICLNSSSIPILSIFLMIVSTKFSPFIPPVGSNTPPLGGGPNWQHQQKIGSRPLPRTAVRCATGTPDSGKPHSGLSYRTSLPADLRVIPRRLR